MRRRSVPQLARLALVVIVAAAVFAAPLPPSLQAQIGGTIGYGSSVYGSIAAAGQSLTYSFNGSVGDLVQVAIRNWTGTLDPRLDLAAPDGQTIAGSADHPFSTDPLEAFLSLYLPQAGIYALRISGEAGTTGDFILNVQGRGPVNAVPLVYGQPVEVTVPVDPSPQYFSFDLQNCPTVFMVDQVSSGQPFSFPFLVDVLNPVGTPIAQLYGGDALEDRLMLLPGTGRYEVTVRSADPETQGALHLLVTCADQAPGCIGSGQAAQASCPPCFSDGEDCEALALGYVLDGLSAMFYWAPVEGAGWYIFSVVDADGTLLADSPRLIEGDTFNTYAFNPDDLSRAPFTAFVSAGSEDEHAQIDCVDQTTIPFDGVTTETCAGIAVGADVVPGAVRAVVAHWTAAPGAQAYLIHVYAVDEDGSLIGIRVLTAPGDATTYHLNDVFPNDYDHFQIRAAAYTEATGGGAFGDMPQGFLCEGGVEVEFAASGPVHWGSASIRLPGGS